MAKTKEAFDHIEALWNVSNQLELIELAAGEIGGSSYTDKKAMLRALSLGYAIETAAKIAREIVSKARDAIEG